VSYVLNISRVLNVNVSGVPPRDLHVILMRLAVTETELKKLSEMVHMLVNSHSGETATDLPDDLTLPMEMTEDLRTIDPRSTLCRPNVLLPTLV